MKSEFNVPWGKKTTIIIPNFATLDRTSQLLGASELLDGDFADSLSAVGDGDFVYLDPPYIPLDHTAYFRHYTWPLFSRDDHQRLAVRAQEIRERGAYVMISNADLPIIRTMFKDWHITEFSVPRSVTAKKDQVRRVSELIITSYPASVAKQGSTRYDSK